METASTSTKLVSLTPLSSPVLGLVLLGLVAGVGLACWGVRHESNAFRRRLMYGLRIAAGLCAAFFLLEPGLRQLLVARVKNRVAVIVDRSASMGFPTTTNGPTRSAVAAQTLERLAPQMESLKESFAFELFGADPELAPITLDALKKTAPRSGKTDLLGVLRAVKASESGSSRKLSGVVLFSDGADNSELAQSGVSGRAKEFLSTFGVPITTVPIGGAGDLQDVAIESVKVDDFAFVRNSITAEVEVHARGLNRQRTDVTLRREGQPVATKPVFFATDDDTQRVTFTFTPDQTGRFVYTVSTPVLPSEVVSENNQKAFTLKVIRDRVRVLLVAGRPSWDERFLRGVLRQDANVELISFYILRNSADDARAGNDELSLIPFPREEIFRTKINTFDLIIVMNFGHNDPGISLEQYSDSFRSYVLNGGALAYVGGDDSFGDAHGRSPIDDLLPLESAGPGDPKPFRAQLTDDGARHPITAVSVGGESVSTAWASLPEIPGLNLTRARPGATVLLEHPSTQVAGKGAPVLSVWETGRGRAMAIATDGTWYWAFPAHSTGAPTRAYERLWSNAIRWLVRDPELTSLTVGAEQPTVEPGKPVIAVMQARLPDYQPAADAQVVIELVAADDGRVVETQTVVAGPDGVARAEFAPPPAGAYKLRAASSKDGKSLGEAVDAVAVRALGTELSDPRVHAELLEEVSKSSGGITVAPEKLTLSEVPFKEPPLVEVGRSKDQPTWDRWYWLLLMVAIVGVEWGVRRRFGYV